MVPSYEGYLVWFSVFVTIYPANNLDRKGALWLMVSVPAYCGKEEKGAQRYTVWQLVETEDNLGTRTFPGDFFQRGLIACNI